MIKCHPFVHKKILEAPQRPGVYIFKDEKNQPIYIGKASNLHNRLKNYLQEVFSHKVKKILKKAKDVEFLLTESDAEALLLEANLIKRYQPRYNIRLKDDKKYPYLKITVNEPYPKIYPTRNLKDDGSIIFGPYTSAKALRKTLRFIRKIFPLRTCHLKLPSQRRHTPCIDYYIGKCLGPCFRNDIFNSYRKNVEGVIQFLTGKRDLLEKMLEEEMKKASEDLNFERAIVLRDQLRMLRGLDRDQRVILDMDSNIDVVVVKIIENIGGALVLAVRNGKVVQKEDFVLDIPFKDSNEEELLEKFLEIYYTSIPLEPEYVVIPFLIPNLSALEEMMRNRGKEIKFRLPNFKEKRLIDLAMENLEKQLEMEIKWRFGKSLIPKSLKELREILQLEDIPVRILAFDVSQLFGRYAVGSSVEFRMGRPYKKGYRKLRIKTTKGINDYEMMREIVLRRFRRELEEKVELPNLILIDGGIGQVRSAKKALEELNIKSVRTLGIAKRFDHLYSEDGKVLMLPPRSEALKLIQRIRDEAHRFALKYHHNLREKGVREIQLLSIPGIGEKRGKELIKYFGSIQNILKASPKELSQVPMIGPKLAEKIYKLLHGE